MQTSSNAIRILALYFSWRSKSNHSKKLLQSQKPAPDKVRWNYYKLRQVSLLQSATQFITNCDRYYKVRWIYYKLRQVLQSAMIITNCDSTECFLKLFLLENVGCDRVSHCQKEKQCAVANCQILCMAI